ncbi:cupin domain-containing protein [Candidatus Bipolaricaulota bacterium]|nr:cupin domain-containing protein [Candidatus Bipolaricaulota bacterium]TFH06683.1 MAG: cupin domain-containing protein [Candidatus Atribacteria bacterium]
MSKRNFDILKVAMDTLGARIRTARKAKGWTLDALASKCGLSTGFLSQVERDLTTLSIVSLSAICHALNVPIETMVSSSSPFGEAPSAVTRADQQLHIQIGGSPISYRYLTGQLPDVPVEELLIAEFPPGCDQQNSSHEGQELGYVLRGSLVLTVQGEQISLNTGDSYRVEASQSHGYHTSESEGANVLMAVTQRFIEIPPQTPRPRGGKEPS